MYSMQTLDQEIRTKAEEMTAFNGRGVPKEWLIQAILSEHKDILGEDADFARCAAYFTVTRRTEAYARSLRGEEDAEDGVQILLPGFNRVQKLYLVDRDGESRFVGVFHMTDEEIDRKMEEHAKFAAGHLAHRDELARFKSEYPWTNGVRQRMTLQAAAGNG